MDIVKQGNLSLEKNDYISAIDYFTEALKQDATNSELWRKRGFCFYQLDYIVHSIMDSENALKLDQSK